MINTLHLREATLDDMDAIMHLETQGFAPGNREERIVYEKRLALFPEGSLIAEYDQTCVGCLFSEIWCAREQLISRDFELGHDIGERHNLTHGTELYISSMTIDPLHRGKQFGFQLFNAHIKKISTRYPNIQSALLLVNENWLHAYQIYKKSGFIEVMRLNQFFSPYLGIYENGIVMRKQFTSAPL